MAPPARHPRKRATTLAVALADLLAVSAGLSGLAVLGVPGKVEAAPSLIAGKAPSRSRGVEDPDRLVDGVAAVDGDPWRTDLSMRFSGERSAVEWDLGEVRPIRCALIVADNEDRYEIEGAVEPRAFDLLWAAPPGGGGGMRAREVMDLNAQARWIRLKAHSGDGRFAVSEVGVYSECPGGAALGIERRPGEPWSKKAQWRLWLFAAVAGVFTLLDRRRARWPVIGVGVLAAVAGVHAARAFSGLYPLGDPEMSTIRAAVAAVAGVYLIRRAIWPRTPLHRVRYLTCLAVLAVVSVGTYYRYGAPQFRDEAKGRGTFVHPWDMRVYFPIAKYFRELRFDGLYLASLAAHIDNHGLSPDAVGHVRLRDLKSSNDMKLGREVVDQLHEVKGRFAPDRWESFKRDMLYFEELMGVGGYLGSLTDHGGNATPVWFLAANLLFRNAPANELTLSLAGAVDIVLLILLLVVIARTFGLEAMLLCAILYGATDFSRFGTNLMGSTLRLDWMAALGFGACALASGWPFVGGFLIAHAGLIRAFPAMAGLFLAVPAFWWLGGFVRRERRLPRLAEIRSGQRPFLRATAGGLVGIVMLAGQAALVLPGSWQAWLAKIAIHAEGPSINNVGLRNIAGYDPKTVASKVIRHGHPEPWIDWQRLQIEAIERRTPIRLLALGLLLAAAVAACRGRRLEQAALVGMLLVPVLFYPSNYYCHFIFLLPLLAFPGRGPPDRLPGVLGAVLMAMCVAQLPTLSEQWGDIVYTQQTVILLGGFAIVLAFMAWTGLRPNALMAAEPKPAGAPSSSAPTAPEAPPEAPPGEPTPASATAEP